MEKISYNQKELADLLDVGETTLANQIVPVIRGVLAEILDETVKTLIDQKERIELLEAENMELHQRLAIVEAHLFPELGTEGVEAELVDPDMVDLESVLGLELEGALPEADAGNSRQEDQIAVDVLHGGQLGQEEIDRSTGEKQVPPGK